MYVIQAKQPHRQSGVAWYYSGPKNGFKRHLLSAMRFRSEREAGRRLALSRHCIDMRNSGAAVSIVRAPD